MRASNLYIVGFWRPTDDQDGHYYALDDAETRDYRYVPNTSALSFDGTYGGLNYGEASNLSALRVGQQQMLDAVNALRTEDNPVPGPNSLRTGLATLIVTVAEAARFQHVVRQVRNSWYSGAELGAEQVSVIRNWSSMSDDYIQINDNGQSARDHRYGRFNVPADRLRGFLRTALNVVFYASVRRQPGSGSCSSKQKQARSLAATSDCIPIGTSSLTPIENPNGKDILFFSGNNYANVNPSPGTNDDRIGQDTWADAFAFGAFSKDLFPNGIDAAVWIPATDYEAWIFSGGQYARIQVKPGDLGPTVLVRPQPIKDNFPSLTKAGFDNGIDAVLPVPGSPEAWFFRGDQYAKVSMMGTDDKLMLGPLPIKGNWPSLTQAAVAAGAGDHYADFTSRITGAVPVPGKRGQAYVFSGSQYVRILAVPDSRGDRVIDGPHNVNTEWPSLVDAGFFPPHFNHLTPRDLPVKSTVFEDDFKGPEGSKPDPKNWSFETGGTGWGNKERQYYTDSSDNAHLDGNGNLAIEARKDNAAGLSCWYGPCEVTSARLVGQDKVTTKYGRAEAKIKVTGAKGAWPAFWMLGDNMPREGWPDAGEIDIMENIGNQPNRLMGTVHGPGYKASGGIGGELIADKPLGDDFHTYRVDWGPDRITWYFDDKAYLSVGKEDLRGYTWVFDHPFYPILNLAVGGDLGGTVDQDDFPTRMIVDYVKISDLGGENPPKSNPPTTGKGWRTWRPEAPAVAVRSTADNTVLDVQYGSKDKGTKVVTWDYTDGDNQRWQLMRHAWDNDFMYRNLGSQLVLDKDGAGTGVLQWEFTDANNQDWVFADAPGGRKGEVRIKNGAGNDCLTNKGRGNQVDTEPCRDGDRNQVWMLDDVHKGPDLGKPTWDDWHLESKSLNIESALNGDLLDVSAASKDEGAQVVTWNTTGQDNQKWRMYRRTTENRFMFRSINSALVLDKNRSGNQTAQFEFGGNANQEWTFEDAGSGTVYIRNGMGSDCLTNTGHGNQATVTPCKGETSQMWRLKETLDTP